MKRVSVLVCMVLAIGACALPAVDQIDLSGCTDICNKQSKACFDMANYKVDLCLDSDAGESAKEACLKEQTKAGEACVNQLLDCETACIKEVETQLGKK